MSGYTRDRVTGALLFSRLVNGVLFERCYMGFTVREARSMFAAKVRREKARAITEKRK